MDFISSDAEQAHNRQEGLLHLHQKPVIVGHRIVLTNSAAVHEDDPCLNSVLSETCPNTNRTSSPMRNVGRSNNIPTCNCDFIDQRHSPLTTQPTPSSAVHGSVSVREMSFVPIMTSSVSMSSLTASMNAVASSSSAFNTSSSMSLFPLRKSSATSQSMPDISLGKVEPLQNNLCPSSSSTSSSSASASTRLSSLSETLSVSTSSSLSKVSSNLKVPSSPHHQYHHFHKSKNHHKYFVHKTPSSRLIDSPVPKGDENICIKNDRNIDQSSKSSNQSQKISSNNTNSFDKGNENQISRSKIEKIGASSLNANRDYPLVVLGSKRQREVSLLSRKRPGKVIRASVHEDHKCSTLLNDCDSNDMEVSHNFEALTPVCSQIDETKVEGIELEPSSPPSRVESCQLESQSILIDNSNFQYTPISSHNSNTPEDLNIGNRGGGIRDLNLSDHSKQTYYQDPDYRIEHIQRVSLVDKLTRLLHSTLETLSNLLYLEDEIDLTPICRKARARSIEHNLHSLTEARDKTENDDLPTTELLDDQHSYDVNSCVNGIGNDELEMALNDSNLTLSRINSLVSLDSFEILSKEDDAISYPFCPPSGCQALVSKSTSDASDSANVKAVSTEMDSNAELGEGHLNVNMASSIEFIHFEVSDLITKRYFDTKSHTQRFLFEKDPHPDAFENKSLETFQLVEVKRDNCEDQTDGGVGLKNSLPTELSGQEDDDKSSASFDIISDDAYLEPFDFV